MISLERAKRVNTLTALMADLMALHAIERMLCRSQYAHKSGIEQCHCGISQRYEEIKAMVWECKP